MSNEKLSVIIPAYNCTKYIRRLLDSIVIQHDDNVEVIICDDHSTEDIQKAIEPFINKLNIIYFVRPDDEYKIHCPGNTRREGLKKATGEWVTFIDNDDEFTPHAFGAFRKLVREHDGEDVTFIWTSLVSESAELVEDNGQALTWLHGKFYKKSFLDEYKIDFRTDLFGNEDLHFNIQVMCHTIGNDYSFISSKFVTYIWRWVNDSLSRKVYDKNEPYIVKYFEDYCSGLTDGFLKFYDIYPEQRSFFVENIMQGLLFIYFYFQMFLYYGFAEKNINNSKLKAAIITYYNILKKMSWTDGELLDRVYSDIKCFNMMKKEATVPGLEFIEHQSFMEFLNMIVAGFEPLGLE